MSSVDRSKTPHVAGLPQKVSFLWGEGMGFSHTPPSANSHLSHLSRCQRSGLWAQSHAGENTMRRSKGTQSKGTEGGRSGDKMNKHCHLMRRPEPWTRGGVRVRQVHPAEGRNWLAAVNPSPHTHTPAPPHPSPAQHPAQKCGLVQTWQAHRAQSGLVLLLR